VTKTLRTGLGLSSLIVLLGCGSKASSHDSTQIGAGAASAAAGASGLPTGELFPTSEPIPGAGGADPGQSASGSSPPSVAEVPVGSSTSGSACQTSTECSSLSCQAGSCSASVCVSDGLPCSAAGECCSGSCESGSCSALNTQCKTSGNGCSSASECCSGLCTDGACAIKSSFCTQSGDVCGRDTECCTGTCQIAQGASVGTCAPPPSGATNCGGGVDGSLCNGCGQCCSRLCAPFGDTGVYVCQPASGCHVNGDLCREDRDCCGAEGTGLPGDGNVVCDKEPGRDVGICRNPMGCSPQGNVCHYQDYACSISSSRNNCCGATGNSGACQLDALGVPRCNGLEACRGAGETCASAADCCDGRRCVPDAEGQLRCATSDEPTACVTRGGACSVNADCCPGVLCNVLPGSTQGVCGGSGSGDPGAGGTGSGGSGGAGSGSPDPEPTYSCALYGQQCSQAADCCTAGLCVYPVQIR
jgi:hypothetical protein